MFNDILIASNLILLHIVIYVSISIMKKVALSWVLGMFLKKIHFYGISLQLLVFCLFEYVSKFKSRLD